MSITQHVLRFVAIVSLTLLFLWLFSSNAATATRQQEFCSQLPTPEPMSVDPVSSPTRLLTQTLFVRLGNGNLITATSEAGITQLAGIFSASTPAPFTIPLLPNVTHHLNVFGQVEYSPGCYYTLRQSTDKHGAPLTIVQTSRNIYLPLIRRN